MAVAPEVPQRTITIKNQMTDTDRWDHFLPRDGDIFVTVPAKSGTTWTQAICAFLIFQTPDLEIKPATVSPWYDHPVAPVEEVVAKLEAQTHRRYVKTHTPLNAIPYYGTANYLCVYRDFRDVFFSGRSHTKNMTMDLGVNVDSGDVSKDFREWVAQDGPDSTPRASLRNFVLHYQSFRAYAHLPNIHLFHYADMKRDLRSAMAAIAKALTIEVDDDLLDELAVAADFTNMKQNADVFAPKGGQGIWKKDADFFNKGQNAQWRDMLSADDLAIYDREMRKLLPEEDIHWLESGSGK